MIGPSARAAPAALALALACAAQRPVPSDLHQREEVATPEGTFVIESARGDGASVSQVKDALIAAAPHLARWGKLRDPVRILLLPSHALLEEAVNRYGYPWLRAWAQYNVLYLESPRSWAPLPPDQGELDETVLHEVTHCLMYQRAATVTSWRRKEIPLWFREGMASVTAAQGYRWPSLDDLARAYAERPDCDPLHDPDELYRDEKDLVYGAAHHAFRFLVWRYGDGAVNAALDEMARGSRFGEAFTAAVGLTPEAFVSDFQRYVRWGGYRQARQRTPNP